MKVSEYSLWEDIRVEIRRGFLSIIPTGFSQAWRRWGRPGPVGEVGLGSPQPLGPLGAASPWAAISAWASVFPSVD